MVAKCFDVKYFVCMMITQDIEFSFTRHLFMIISELSSGKINFFLLILLKLKCV